MTAADWIELFDGETPAGWHARPRTYGTLWPGGPEVRDAIEWVPFDYNEQAALHPARWSVEDGALTGRQDPDARGWGGYLVTDDVFGDFELELEMKPDWPADTGVLVRRRDETWEGIQIVVDHRSAGSIGGFYGNGIGGFHAIPYCLDVARDEHETPVALVLDDAETSLEPFDPAKKELLERAGNPEPFLAAWRFGDWNRLRIRCVGDKPNIATWVNDVFVAEIDLATMQHPRYDAAVVLETLGPKGHIALEVHDNDPQMGDRRWGPGAACRWRNIRIRPLSQ